MALPGKCTNGIQFGKGRLSAACYHLRGVRMARVTTGRIGLGTLIRLVSEESDVALGDVDAVLKAFFDVVARQLAAQGSVAISNFGTFRAPVAQAITRRNPKSGK